MLDVKIFIDTEVIPLLIIFFWYYWNKNTNKTRLVITDIKTTGITNFQLTIQVLLEQFQELRFLVALKQYYILSDKPANNSVLVAEESPGGEHLSEQFAKPIFMYQQGVLLYKFNSFSKSINSVALLLNADFKVRQQNLDENSKLYLDTFQFTTTPIGEIDPSTMLTVDQLKTVHKVA